MSSVVEISQALAFAITLAASPVNAAPQGASTLKSMPTAWLHNATSKHRTSRNQAGIGQFQFTSQSWLHGVILARGMPRIGRFASRIFKTSSGRYYVPVQSERRTIDAALRNADIAFVVAVNLARRNKKLMARALARPAKAGELYIAHWFGVQKAIKFIKAARADRGKSGASLFPNLALAHTNLFFSRSGTNGRGNVRSISAIYSSILRSFDFASSRISVATKARYARLASLIAPNGRHPGRSKVAGIAWSTTVHRALLPDHKKPL